MSGADSAREGENTVLHHLRVCVSASLGSMVSRLQGGFGEWRAGERAERATAEFVPGAGFKRARGGKKGCKAHKLQV